MISDCGFHVVRRAGLHICYKELAAVVGELEAVGSHMLELTTAFSASLEDTALNFECPIV